ncbi:MAG: FkbM family methyltransferase [Planctomycetaceae bacterium]
MISYAQNFEDVVLDRVFHGVDQGRYIDLGGYDPVVDSVTKHFYDRGWSGVNVEPVERFHRRFVEHRPRDTNLNVAVGATSGTACLHEWGDTGLASCHEPLDEQLASVLGLRRADTTVPMVTLAEITLALGDAPVDFLKIDVEGGERDVILGGEWRAFRPRVIVVEAVKPQVPGVGPRGYEPAWFAWEGLLFGHGYEFALFDGLNRFYYRREEPHLREPLSYPANVTDGFTLVPGHYLARPLQTVA